MRIRSTYFILLFLLWSATGFSNPAAETRVKVLLQQANQLMDSAKDNKALQTYEEAIALDPGCYEALWKASYLKNRIGLRYSDEVSKLLSFQKAWTYADAALCANPDDAEGNYVMALSVYNKAMVSGVKERMLRTNDIKFFLDKALKDNPEHAAAWQLLGRWNYRNANLSMPERTALNMFFGGVPLEASNEKAMEALQNAIQYDPKNISSYYDLATVYMEMDKPDLCQVTLQEAMELELRTSEELQISKRCKLMLERIEKHAKI